MPLLGGVEVDFRKEQETFSSPGCTMSDQDHLRQAIQLAAEHCVDGRNGPFGAVVVKNGEVVGRGWNRVVELSDPTAHAEVLAIRDACRRLRTHDLKDCVLYSSCEPCPMCLSAIYWARIPRVVFAASSEEAAAAGFDDARIRDELCREWGEREMEGIREPDQEALEILNAWAENPLKLRY
jgi:guanine deaminase